MEPRLRGSPVSHPTVAGLPCAWQCLDHKLCDVCVCAQGKYCVHEAWGNQTLSKKLPFGLTNCVMTSAIHGLSSLGQGPPL